MLKYGDSAKVLHRESPIYLNDRTAFYQGCVGKVVGLKDGVYTLMFLPEELKGVGDLAFFKDLILQAFRENELEKVPAPPRENLYLKAVDPGYEERLKNFQGEESWSG